MLERSQLPAAGPLRRQSRIPERTVRFVIRWVSRGLTQEQFGEQCNLHRTFIGSVERGERNLSILNLRLIARILRTSLPDLFSGTTEDGQTG